jgi:transcriptional regulator with XRE-family HTH domain
MKNLKNIREKRNINQLKLAIDIGITQESISKYETR